MNASSESQIGLALQYKIAFETWRFQVNSYWQRNSYFAAFQSVALAAAWKILGYRSAIALCAAGIVLALIWYFNNLKVHSYIHYWWKTIGKIEESDSAKFTLVSNYEELRWESRIARSPFAKYSRITNAIPILFFVCWLWMLGASIHALPHEGDQRPATGGTASNAPTTPTVPQTATPSPEIPLAPPISSSPPASQSAQTAAPPSEIRPNRSEGREEEGEFKGYNKLSVPNNFYSSGLAFGVDRQGNRYVLSDLVKEAGLKTDSAEPPYTSFSASIPNSEVEKAIDENRWGDLVSRVLFAVKTDAVSRDVGDVKLNVQKIEATRTDLTNARQAVQKTQFWQHYTNLLNLRLFLVAETISSHHVILDFPDTTVEVLNKAFSELREMGPETFIDRNPRSIEIISHLPLILACRAVELETKTSSENRSTPRLLATRLDVQGQWHGLLTPIAQKENTAPTVRVLGTVPLQSTHYSDTPPLVSVARNATYGAILNDLKQKIFAAGIDEVRIHESGFGFAVATRLEVTEQNGEPLPGEARFLVHQALGKKWRGYYITVDAYPKPEARVSTKRIVDLFLGEVGSRYLPDNMEAFRIEPGSAVRVYVLEFDVSKSEVREVPNQECGSSAQAHMTQSGLVKSGQVK